MTLFRKLDGLITDALELGLGGPLFKRSGGVVELRNNDDTAFARLRIAPPVDSGDAATKLWVQTQSGLAVRLLTADLTVATDERFVISDLEVANGFGLTVEDGGGVDVL